MKKIWREKQIYYGLAILAVVFVVVGLTQALKGEKKSAEVMKEEKIVREEVPDQLIRVLIMTTGYKGTVHSDVTVSGPSGLIVTYGEEEEKIAGNTPLHIAPDDARFQTGNIRICPKEGEILLESIQRGCGTPSYEGALELWATAEGIVIINELPVESYLCKVVPSEMPSSYEPEALKAQAVCARSYAYRQMESCAYPEYGAHVNDSTDYQVYGNSASSESAITAVQETAGEVVRLDGQIVTTYYYSTSCGKTTSVAAWGTEETEENRYLQSVEVKNEEGDFERNLPWYRWEAAVPVQTLSNLVGINTGTDIGTVKDIQITETGPGGVAVKMTVTGDKGNVTVETENKIRRALGGKGYKICRQDGTQTDSAELLPSAFFTAAKEGENFVFRGGGYGHGIGMSQNGANEMAKCGKNYKEILTLFYQGVTIER
ncbi:SpoIID/LytB domain-containing protein [Faecalicatena contorta]|uniref:SpoIID/LytB domain-containing protein n=1 Tax=Faecalicatena contorta TaxID=39482 RepID=UPI001F221FCE|nr:SpoIID/LytB domain-containing protein [Faecalicatena contorta]